MARWAIPKIVFQRIRNSVPVGIELAVVEQKAAVPAREH
jgi:hypothetical protein